MFESIQKVSNSLINYFCSSNSFDWMFYQKKKKKKRERPRRNENGNRSNYLYRNGLKNGSYFLLYCRKTVIILLLLEWSAVSYATLWWFIDLSWLICCFSHFFLSSISSNLQNAFTNHSMPRDGRVSERGSVCPCGAGGRNKHFGTSYRMTNGEQTYLHRHANITS